MASVHHELAQADVRWRLPAKAEGIEAGILAWAVVRRCNEGATAAVTAGTSAAAAEAVMAAIGDKESSVPMSTID